MLTENDSLREFGGAALRDAYPDRGLIANSEWYQATLTLKAEADDDTSPLDRLTIATHAFSAVVSANAEGLRVLVTSEQFVVFIPWTDTDVSMERRDHGQTIVLVRTTLVSSRRLVIRLADRAADDLFRWTTIRTVQRRSAAGWLEPWTLPAVVTIVVLAAALLWAVTRG